MKQIYFRYSENNVKEDLYVGNVSRDEFISFPYFKRDKFYLQKLTNGSIDKVVIVGNSIEPTEHDLNFEEGDPGVFIFKWLESDFLVLSSCKGKTNLYQLKF